MVRIRTSESLPLCHLIRTAVGFLPLDGPRDVKQLAAAIDCTATG